MYTKSKKSGIAIGLLFFSAASIAQSHEFGFAAGAGYGGLRYNVKGEESKLKPTVNFGLTYTWLCKAGWGLHTGIQLGFMRTETALPGNTMYISNAVDNENEGFEFRVQQKGYAETQKLYTLDIPLMLQWQTTSKSKTAFYARAGGKFSVPVKRSFDATAAELTTTGYYPAYNVELANLPQFGFGTKQNWKYEGDFDLKTSIALAAEAGAKFRIGKSRSLYAGAYLDYGLTDMRKQNDNNSFFQYSASGFDNTKASSLLNRPEIDGSIRMISYGIRLQYAFGLNCK